MKKLICIVVISIIGLTALAALVGWKTFRNFQVSAANLLTTSIQPGSGPAAASTNQSADQSNAARFNESYGRLPMSFELNQGQADPEVRYLARGRGYQVLLTETETILRLQNNNRLAGTDARYSPLAGAVKPQSSTQRADGDTPSTALRIKLAGAADRDRLQRRRFSFRRQCDDRVCCSRPVQREF